MAAPVEGEAQRQRLKRPVACNYCRLKKVRCSGTSPCSNCVDHHEACTYPVLQRRVRKEVKKSRVLEERLARMETLLQVANVAAVAEGFAGEPTHFRNPHRREMSAITVQDPRSRRSPSSRNNAASSSVEVTGSGEARTQQNGNEIQDVGPIMEEDISSTFLGSPTATTSINFSGNTQRHSFHSPEFPSIEVSAPRRDSIGMSLDSAFQPDRQRSVPLSSSTSGVYIRRQESLAVSMSSASGFNGRKLESLTRTPATSLDTEGSCVFSPENSNWEYHGPGSYLSICSPPGVQWVSDRIGSSDFVEIARKFTMDLTMGLKLDRKLPQQRAPEPSQEIAWAYSNAYFELCPEATHGVVYRPSFEARLRSDFDESMPDDDSAWYALRNIVYAFGCRTLLARGSSATSYNIAQNKSWEFFENALSVHTELLYCRTGIMAVHALAAMASLMSVWTEILHHKSNFSKAFFVEGLGAPSLEYMLCCGAAILAQSKGLHRQAATSWNLTEHEIAHRNWLFWGIYCYEKHLSARSGRPSAIDDDNISCQIPTTAPPGHFLNIEYCTFVVKHALISSRISKRLAAVKTFRQTPEEVFRTVEELNQQLEQWRESIPIHLRPGQNIEPLKLPENTHIYHVLYLHFSYYGSLIDIHSIFTNPWIGALLGTDQSPAFHNKVVASTNVVVEASRNIILATKHVNVDASSPVMMAFYYPILGMINLFIYILKYPLLPSVQSDISLLDVGAGHFARLQFVSGSQLAFPFAREMANLVRVALSFAREQQRDSINGLGLAASYRPDSRGPYLIDSNGNLGQVDTSAMLGMPGMIYGSSESRTTLEPDETFNSLGGADIIDFEMENWSTLLPSFIEDADPRGANMGFANWGNGEEMSAVRISFD